MSSFEAWIRDSLTQSLLLSPLMGVILGGLLSWFTRGPSESGARSVREAIVIIRERVVIRETSSRWVAHSQEGAWGLFIAWIIVAVGAIYLYAVYANDIIHYAAVVTFTVLAFGFAVLVVAGLDSRISGFDWVFFTLMPMGFVGFTLILLNEAEKGILPWAREAATGLGAYKFYFQYLERQHQMWLLSQLVGLCLTVLYLLLSTALLVHSIAALQARYSGTLQGFWAYLFIHTEHLSGWLAAVVACILALISFLALNGVGYEALMRHSG